MKPFLTAEWHMLAMLNWRVDPALVRPYAPPGTELDFHAGETYVSIVGFLFRDTRVMGFGVPFHSTFEEVNLRLYIRRGERRAVTFISEVVPRWAIAAVARRVYNEPYVALRMQHRTGAAEARYSWQSYGGEWLEMGVAGKGEPALPEPGSREEFIAEHYWGYCKQRDGGVIEYQVEHPPWRLWAAREVKLKGDISDFYPRPFAPTLMRPPDSAFLAEGSRVAVHRPVRL